VICVKLIVLGLVATALATPSKTVRLAIVHTVHGCHVWHSGTGDAGAATKLTLHRGDKLELRVTCPMDFTLTQLRGSRLALGDPTLHSGTVRSITFRGRGIFVLRATNIQSSEQMGLQTLGPDNALTLTITVR
jgi:hypothetical protein